MSEKKEQLQFRIIPAPNYTRMEYRIGTDGSVWKRIKEKPWRRQKAGPWSRLTPCIDRTRWNHVRVRIYGRTCWLHRLVLEAFVGPCPDGMEGCHNDGDPLNNQLGNLRWDTPAGNLADKIRHDRVLRGSKAPMAKTNEMAVQAMDALRSLGWTHKNIAIAFKLSTGQVEAIINRRCWQHVPRR